MKWQIRIFFGQSIKHTFANSVYTDRKGIFVQIKLLCCFTLAYIAFNNEILFHNFILPLGI